MTAPTIDFNESRLDNGLRVVLAEDHLTPVVAVNLWYDIGSKHEEEGKTGIAHLFEHMMFQGTPNVAKGEHFKLVQGAGGTLNATTWLHRTNYFEYGPSNALELFLWLEADRLGNLLGALGQETLDNQRDVVRNERRQRYDNVPYGLWWENMTSMLFPEGHPYHHTTIGSMEDLANASLEDVRAFFSTWYAPNNAVLTVAGDFDPAQAKGWIDQYFGPLKPNDAIPASPECALPLQIEGGEQRRTIESRVPLPRVYFGWRTPGAGQPGGDAVAVARAVLAGASGMAASKSSRLHRTLVREREIAQDVAMFAWEFAGTSCLLGWATAKPGTEISALEAAFHEVTDGLAAEAPSDAEMDRARASLERSIIDGNFVTSDSRADFLSEHATVFGDPGKANERLPALLAVTAGEVREAARSTFRADNRAVITFLPEDKEAAR